MAEEGWFGYRKQKTEKSGIRKKLIIIGALLGVVRWPVGAAA